MYFWGAPIFKCKLLVILNKQFLYRTTTPHKFRQLFYPCYRRYNRKLYYDYHDVTDGKRTSPYKGDDNVYSTTAFTRRAVELISAHNTTKPMFMYLAYQAPHTPVQVHVTVIYLLSITF